MRRIGERGRPTTDMGVSSVALWAGFNLTFDLALLWAAARMWAVRTSPGRLLVGALLGSGYWLVVGSGLVTGSTTPAGLAVTVVLTSLLMVGAALRPRTLRAYLRLLATLYGVTFVAGGAGAAVGTLLGAPPGAPHTLAGAAAALAVILAVSLVGWPRAAQQWWLRPYRIPVRIRFGSRWAMADGFIDTGNQLRDPVSATPVLLVDARVLDQVMDEGTRQVLGQVVHGRLPPSGTLWALEAVPEWSRRFRLVPYRSVGTERGLLVGFRADAVVLEGPAGRRTHTGPLVVALSATPLDWGAGRGALIPPALVAGGVTVSPSEAAKGPAANPSAHRPVSEVWSEEAQVS